MKGTQKFTQYNNDCYITCDGHCGGCSKATKIEPSIDYGGINKMKKQVKVDKNNYTFDELSDDAKEKAREWMREASDFSDYSESVIDDAKEVGKLMGIRIDKVYYSGFSSQGDGACFEGNYAYVKGSVKAVKEYAPQDEELARLAHELQCVQARYFYGITASVKQHGHYSHSRSNVIDVELDGYQSLDNEHEEMIRELLRDFMDWIYKSLETEYDFQNSDEQIDETIRINEYTFTIDGKRDG